MGRLGSGAAALALLAVVAGINSADAQGINRVTYPPK